MSEIIVAGDFCSNDRVNILFENEQYERVLGEIKPIVESADYALVNLESPIVIGKGTPIKKSGPNLRSSKKIVEAIKYVGFKGVTLANNHFYDYGEDGALSTLSILDENGIDHVGAGKNIEVASQILYINVDGETIAFINCCEHEFSIASETKAGSNPLDIISQYHAIQDAKLIADHIIVIIHGGIEMYQLPNPRMVKMYRFFIEVGADAVINHHQHCFSGFEYYQGRPIVYGLGNFCFDWRGKRNGMWNEGYFAKITFDGDKVMLSTIPYHQCDEKPAVLLSVVDEAMFNQRMEELCDIIVNENRLLNEYERFLEKTWKNYDIINIYSNRYLNWLARKGFLPSLMSKKRLRSILNAIRCESHHDRLEYALLRKLNALGTNK